MACLLMRQGVCQQNGPASDQKFSMCITQMARFAEMTMGNHRKAWETIGLIGDQKGINIILTGY